jgi:AmiR/NasT family two-component response regulator
VSQTQSLLHGLRETHALVVHPRDRDGEELIRHLQRIGCQVQSIWPPPAQVPKHANIVFYLLERQGSSYLPWRPGDRPLALIAIVDYESPTVLRALIESNAHAVISKPIRPFGILTNLVMARALHSYEMRLLGKIGKLEETLRSRRDIDKAIQILMSIRGISEDDAYKAIRQQAMSKRVSTALIASSIINANEVLEGPRVEASSGAVRERPRGSARRAGDQRPPSVAERAAAMAPALETGPKIETSLRRRDPRV